MDEIFNLFEAATENENCFLTGLNHSQKQKTKVYSGRSFNREINALTKLLDECHRKNKTLVWIAPFHEKIFSNLDTLLTKNLVWISPVNFSSSLDFIIDDPQKLNFFLRDIKKSDSLCIETHTCFNPFGLKDSIQSSIIRLLKNSAVRLKTIEHFNEMWKHNFLHNHKKWLSIGDISHFKGDPPDFLVLGGPSVDLHLAKLRQQSKIWCADTALPTLLYHNLIPQCVFSLDAGHGSYEHFIYAIDHNKISEMTLVIDPLSFPALFDLKFSQKLTCANSNPLIQQSRNNFTVIENTTDDVFGFMQNAYEKLFKNFHNDKTPEILGRDNGHIKKVTHLRGSAYHRRQYTRNNRLATPEQYFFLLSNRYSHS